MRKDYPVIDTLDALEEEIARVKAAQAAYASYTQEQVDAIFLAAATAANKARIPLAKAAVAETGMGIVEDKVIKNHFASEYIYNAYRNTKTCGVIEEDKAYGMKKIAEPLGLVCAIIPTTNPTSTAIFKALICLKTRNAIISASRRDMIGATLYLVGRSAKTGELLSDAMSCTMCKRQIINAGIAQVVIRTSPSEYRVIPVSDWVENDDSIINLIG